MSIEIVGLHRYPVKSMQGETLDTATIGPRGIIGDRAWGVVDEATGYVLTARREARLLLATPRPTGEPGERPGIELPDGTTATDDTALSAWLGRDVRLVRAGSHGRATYETPIDAEDEDAHEWFAWQGPEGTFHDSTRTQISIASTTAIGQWPARRFRPNIVASFGPDGDDHTMASPEFALVGTIVALGSARVEVGKRIDRCVMTTRPQPGGIDRDLDVLRSIQRDRGGDLGVGALVIDEGIVHVGDPLTTTT